MEPKQDLIWRQRFARNRIGEIEALLHSQTIAPASYRAQELRGELTSLRGDVIGLEYAISIACIHDTDARFEKLVEAETDNAVAVRLRFIEKLEREGDWRQAKIHRIGLLEARKEIRQQMSVIV